MPYREKTVRIVRRSAEREEQGASSVIQVLGMNVSCLGRVLVVVWSANNCPTSVLVEPIIAHNIIHLTIMCLVYFATV